jgi:hypothetical protein
MIFSPFFHDLFLSCLQFAKEYIGKEKSVRHIGNPCNDTRDECSKE